MATFGNTAICSSNSLASSDAYNFTAPGNGTITAVTAYIATTNTVKMFVYADSSGSPGALLASSSAFTGTSPAAWQTASLSLAITTGTVYWFCVGVASGSLTGYWQSQAGVTQSVGITYGSNPASGFTDYAGYTGSIYATYTPSGGGGQSEQIVGVM